MPRLASTRLDAVRRRSTRLVIGLISGTSIDAVEAALCRVRGSGARVRLSLLAHHALVLPRQLSQRVRSADTAAELCELNFELGEWFARAALAVARRSRVSIGHVDLIGSHGQTIAHRPRGVGQVASTLQLGEGSVIAERTGLPVICDFRAADVSAGGQGAPLVPYFDWALFRPRRDLRALLNLGGIANVSVVGRRLEDTVAFDTGPGNMLLDAVMRLWTRNRKSYDLDGRHARAGRVRPRLLEELLAHPFLSARPPKSAGRELFGDQLAGRLWRAHGRHPEDLLATCAAFTVESAGRAFDRWVLPGRRVDAVYVSGGGSRNPVLMDGLRSRLRLPVRSLDELGFPERAKEAACFALLASECVSSTPTNVPSATGARGPRILGKMIP